MLVRDQEAGVHLAARDPQYIGPGPATPQSMASGAHQSLPSVHPAVLRIGVITLLFALAGLSFAFFTRPYAASVRLFAFERKFMTKTEAADFSAMVKSSDSIAKLEAKLPQGISPKNLADLCEVSIEPGQPYVTAIITDRRPESARLLAEVFAAHVASCADDWVSKRAAEIDRQIAMVQRRLGGLREQLAHSTPPSQLPVATMPAFASSEPAPIPEVMALRTVQQDLAQALAKFTEEHPRVKELRASVAALEKEIISKSQFKENTPAAATMVVARTLPKKEILNASEKSKVSEVELARMKSEFTALSGYRDQLIQARIITGSKDTEKWRQAEHVTVARVTEFSRLFNHYAFGAFAGLGLVAAGNALRRRRYRVIRDAVSLGEATRLPVLAVLPPLKDLSESAREYWAVETLNLIRNSARADRRGCFVCGVISSTDREGRSAVIDLLANAGLRSGNRVLVIPSPDFSQPANSVVAPPPSEGNIAVARQTLMMEAGETALPVHWERAFATWQHEKNALVLVELPPATTADALVYSAGVPNVLWLSGANVADSKITSRCVDSLRNSGCHLIGAALNMCSSLNKRTASWAVLAAGLIALTTASAQQPAPPAESPAAATPTAALSATKSPMLAPWQEKLTLGPGDVFDVSLYGQADTARQVVIGPDGRFSYLQAVDVTGTGATVDELRAKLEQILMKFHLAPRVVISPLAFRSKKYYMLGNVVGRGAYPLDKPTTIVEAVARAKGFVSGTGRGSTFTLADMSQAFLMRRHADGSYARERVDFENLFQRGELQNNKLLAPDDYLYFPPADADEVYVLGEIQGIGALPYTKGLTVLGAIAGRGGFKDSAFRQKILVIRGSLERPATFVVNTDEILRAVAKDFSLQPKDIVYVSRKPWAKAEELLEAASSDFVRAVVVTWTGKNVQPLIR
jgi:protein involved in polysaccharide export with SLBB domain